ncbi:MAG: type IX secretion system membrane protein PorP/SprF [Bacteroidota bacterium]
MKKLYTLLKITVVGCLSFAGGIETATAQDPEFTQFYANPLYLNPAFAGSARCPRIAMNYRNQWPSLSGTYVTTSASYDQHVDGIYGGLGLLVTNDKAGEGTLNTTTISGIYSYQLKISRTFSIRAGVQATYFQKSLDWNKLTFGDMIDPRRGFVYQTGDVPRGGTVGNVDFSAGILGFSEYFFAGFAAHHLTEPNESLITGNSPMPMKITGHAGAVIPLSNSKYSTNDSKLSPNILYRSQGTFQQLNMGLYMQKGPLCGGVWYRNKDAFIALVGINTTNVKIGYSYDVTVSKLTNASGGSHEISFMVNFNCKPKKKSFRTISCPSF